MSAINWPKDLSFRELSFEPEDRACTTCGRKTFLCDHRHRRFWTLQGPVHVVSKLAHCPDKTCPASKKTFSSLAELALAPPGWRIAWDVFSFIGHRRFARHWSVPQIRAELRDSYRVFLSDDAIEAHIHRYQFMVAARQQDLSRLREEYKDVKDLVLTIDGLQPETGHETLYVVRELRRARLWFATPLLSGAVCEIVALLERAKEIAAQLEKPVAAWMTDKQETFVQGLAQVFPKVPHLYCKNHFLRNLAEPLLAADGHAKKKMRSKVRGLREVERAALDQLAEAKEQKTTESIAAKEAAVVVEYSAAIRGILVDDQGGPLHPPGMRMAKALAEVQASLARCLEAKKGALPSAS
jgi:hypothetical protein